MLDFSRIQAVIDVPTLQGARVTAVGCGAAANLERNLVRCGLGTIDLVDHDRIEPPNICRQEYMVDAIGMAKVDALAADLRRINPQVQVNTFQRDFCTFSEAELREHFGETDLFLLCVDNLAAHARQRSGIGPAETDGVVRRLSAGRAGEIGFWTPECVSCFRCLCAARYRAAAAGTRERNVSDSPDILAVQLIDAITGMITIGILTRGADNTYGRLIAPLVETQRNFLQVKVDPDWTWNGRDIFREYLGVSDACDAFFSFVTIARRDP